MRYQKTPQFRNNLYFDLIQQVGSNGKYQIIITIIFSFHWLILGALQLGPTVLFITTIPICTQYPDINQCEKYICTLSQSQRYQYYRSHIDSLAYIFQNLFICSDKYKLTLLMGLIYVGCFFSNFVFSYFTDNYGRKYSLRLTWACVCFGLIIVTISWNLYVFGLGLFIIGLGVQQSQSITLMIFYQQVQKKQCQKYCMIVQMAFCVGGLSIAIVFWWIQHWQIVFVVFLTIPSIIIFFFMNYYVQQTPKFLIKRHGVNITLNSLRKIAQINKIQTLLTNEDIEKYQDLQIIQDKNKIKIRMWQLFKFPSLRKKTICICIAFYAIVALYFGPLLFIHTISANQYINQIILSLAQFFTYFITYFCVTLLPRKSISIASFVLCLLINFYLLTFRQVNQPNQILLQIGLVCLVRFFISMSFALFLLYCNQLYPSATRGVGAGLYCAFGRVSNITITIIIQLLNYQHLAYYYFIICSILGFFAMLPLKQTVKQALTQDISQLGSQGLHEQQELKKSLTPTKRKLTL